jgi:lipoprotein-releasing system ATP-binding protein
MLHVRDLYKTYRLGKVPVPVLRGVSLRVQSGEFVAILGASGSGKSTLLHLVGGLDKPDPGPAGAIEVDGRNLARASARELDAYRARTIGFVFQFYHLLPELTVLGNVLLAAMIERGVGYAPARGVLRRRAEELLESVGLRERARHRPAELSGGERQRVAIARALMNEPRMLLADEPTGNLDHETGARILDVLGRVRRERGLTMIVVTHDAEVAARADRQVRLVDGRIAERV